MNIFYLDKDPVIAAQLMCNKHVVKMIVESAQMLSTTHRVCDGDDYANEMGLYKLAHKNHPSTKWVRSNHATSRLRIALYKPPTNIVHGVPVTDPPQCMPEECKQDDTVFAYQTYYIVEKSRFAKWTKREIPTWFIGGSDGKRKSVELGA